MCDNCHDFVDFVTCSDPDWLPVTPEKPITRKVRKPSIMPWRRGGLIDINVLDDLANDIWAPGTRYNPIKID